ncbi:MAG: hypothetical protein KC636_17375, partial [Myxococcales bacterium]|nr:hypothetical protein [Myxococcales bacterium]
MARSKKRGGGGGAGPDLLTFLRTMIGKKDGDGDGDGKKSGFGWIWGAGAVICVVGTMMATFTTIEAGQVAVRINNITGGHTVVTQPGWLIKMPYGIHSVYVLDASLKNFTMSGNDDTDALNVRELTVRASDGSN